MLVGGGPKILARSQTLFLERMARTRWSKWRDKSASCRPRRLWCQTWLARKFPICRWRSHRLLHLVRGFPTSNLHGSSLCTCRFNHATGCPSWVKGLSVGQQRQKEFMNRQIPYLHLYTKMFAFIIFLNLIYRYPLVWYVHIYIYVYTHTHIYTHIYICTHIYIYVHTHVCIYIDIYI